MPTNLQFWESTGWYLRDHAKEQARVKTEIPVNGYDAETWNMIAVSRKWDHAGCGNTATHRVTISDEININRAASGK